MPLAAELAQEAQNVKPLPGRDVMVICPPNKVLVFFLGPVDGTVIGLEERGEREVRA